MDQMPESQFSSSNSTDERSSAAMPSSRPHSSYEAGALTVPKYFPDEEQEFDQERDQEKHQEQEQWTNQQLEEKLASDYRPSINQQIFSTELPEASSQVLSGGISFALASGIILSRGDSDKGHSSSRPELIGHIQEKESLDQAQFSAAANFHLPSESSPLVPLPQSTNSVTFSELSTEQEEREEERFSLDVSDEAEHLTNADSLGSFADSSDYGYDSDELTSASTSIAPSVRDFMYENGWRYHRYREGSYNFPNDEVEQEREDLKHAMVKLLCGEKLHFAPIGDNPQEILDIGTGTGIWSIEMGDRYPSARILGIDLSPHQPEWLPPNVRFLVDDAESQWLHPRDHFDYIHARHTVMAIRNWRELFRQAFEHLKPGGWMELQEVHHYPHSARVNQEMPPDHSVAKFWKNVTEGLEVLGVNFHAAADGNLLDKMREAGFTNVSERVLHIPIGPWPKNKVLKRVGLYWRTILLDGLQAISIGPFTRGLKWTRDEVEVFLMDVRRAYFDNALLMYMPFHIIQGQKPLHPPPS